MAATMKTCSVCEERFLVKFRYQVENRDGKTTYFCTQECLREASEQRGEVRCDRCETAFDPQYAYQKVEQGDETNYYCSMDCRQPAVDEYRSRRIHEQRGPMRIAILNQKGGTGKTTTTVSTAAGLAEAGHRVLVIDVDSQGHVGVSLGVDGNRSLYDLLVDDVPLEDCVVPARPNLDVVPGDDSLASAEIFLARQSDDDRDRLLRQHLGDNRDYDFVLLDCAPSLSVLNMNALTFADHLLVPVSCDFLSLVGVKQVMQTLKKINEVLLHSITLLGILPTFYDQRNNISDQSIKTLEGHFQDKVLSPIRVNTKLKEAPQHERTIFEYAPNSRGARDYRQLVDWVARQYQQRAQASA